MFVHLSVRNGLTIISMSLPSRCKKTNQVKTFLLFGATQKPIDYVENDNAIHTIWAIAEII